MKLSSANTIFRHFTHTFNQNPGTLEARFCNHISQSFRETTIICIIIYRFVQASIFGFLIASRYISAQILHMDHGMYCSANQCRN
jgi:hypothetical protein